MLHFLLDADRLKNTDALIGRICARAAEGTQGQILIVPEQYSHAAERALCAAGGDTISRGAEVLSFTRLASRLLSVYGGVCEEYLDKGGRLLSVYLAAEQVRSRLKYYASVSTKPEFLLRLGAAMEEFLSYCLPPEALREAAQRVSGQFAQKLEELSLLYESYLSVCKNGRSDPVTRLERLRTLLQQTDYASEHVFYLDGFSDFTAAEHGVLTELLRRAPEIHIALCTDGSGRAVFQAASETAAELKKEAARWNVPVTTGHPSCPAVRAEALCGWLDGLFSPTQTLGQDAAGRLFLHHAPTAEQECAYAAWRVRRLLQTGSRCREIGIALSDRAAYEPVLRTLFSRMQLPAYFAGTEDILSQPLFAAVLCAMEAVDRYDNEPMLAFLKSGISPLARDEADRLEKYAFTWSIRGKLWEETWTMHPDGFGAEWDEERRAELEQLNASRSRAVSPLASLRRAWHAEKNAGEMVMALDEFLTALDAGGRMQQQAQAQEAAGEAQRAQQTRQLFDILIDAMEQTYQVLGACVMEPPQFTAMFRMLLSQYQVGTIPAAVDQVQIGPLESFRSLRTKHLIVLGAEEGKLPAFAPALGVFTEDERQRLRTMGLALAPAQEDRLDREMGWIRAALCAAEESCSLCYSGAEPSFLFTRTLQMFDRLSVTEDAEHVFAPDVNAAAAALLRAGGREEPHIHALSEAVSRLRRCGAYDFTPVARQTVCGLYGNQIALSASRIDRYAACRYAFFLYDGLRLRPWKQARFDAPLFGTFVHKVLEKTVREVMDLGGFAAVEEESLLKIAARHAQEYTRDFMPEFAQRGERFAYLYNRNLNEVLAVVQDVGQELRASKFIPRDCELHFARGTEQEDTMPPIRVHTPSGESVVSGFVDRVDLYETEHGAYYRVVDYKTGKKDLDYAGLLCGEDLQMLIYLFALKEHGQTRYGRRLFPAGVLYVPAREEMESVPPGTSEEKIAELRAKKKRRKGLLLDDETILQAMEPSDGTPRYLPYQLKKGERTGDLATREQLALLERFVMQSLQEMTGAMFAGGVTPNPILRGQNRSSCEHCDFVQACHKDACCHENRYIAEIKSERFWQEVERRCTHG